MFEMIVGDELELVALSGLLDTFEWSLCCFCRVRCIVTWVGKVLVGCKANCHIKCGQHVVPDHSVSFSSN